MTAAFEGSSLGAPRSLRCSNLIGVVTWNSSFVTSRSPTKATWGTHLSWFRTDGTSHELPRRRLVGNYVSESHGPKVETITIHGSEAQVNSYPASEQWIRDVERGRSCNAILPMPPGRTLAAGDFFIFALAYSNAGQETHYVMGGDSVRVQLTNVTDLGATDPATAQALFRLSWEPLGQSGSPDPVARRVVKSRGPHGQG